MGLPPESLDFLTRGAKFSRPPLGVTLKNAPGLFRLLGQEMSLPRQFARVNTAEFAPALKKLQNEPIKDLSLGAIAPRIETILALLTQVTYYNIMAPLSLALRQALFKVDLATLDNAQSPEIMAVEALKKDGRRCAIAAAPARPPFPLRRYLRQRRLHGPAPQ